MRKIYTKLLRRKSDEKKARQAEAIDANTVNIETKKYFIALS